MIMKLINDEATILAGFQTTLINARRWVNEAQSILANKYTTARKEQTVSITAADNKTYYPLPADCLGVILVTDSEGYGYKKYRTRGLNIIFEQPGTYNVTYGICCPNVGIREDSVPEINAAYHDCLSNHIAARELETRNPSKALQREQEFYVKAADANRTLKNMKVKGKRMPAPLWR